MSGGGARLYLCGDDDVLDLLADQSRHLEYDEVSRLEAPPDGPLGARDHVVIAKIHAQAALADLTQVVNRGAGHAQLIAPLHGASVGARAILAAAELVRASYPLLGARGAS